MTANRLITNAILRQNTNRPPIWFMRQAGRYHQHYQELKKKHTFVELCKDPDLACEVTMGPIDEFQFDAAILFSDILFPLEVLGMGLDYNPGPKLDWHLKDPSQLSDFVSQPDVQKLRFQNEALTKIRNRLPASTGLLGFVGAPLTLYVYAVEGSHQGGLDSARTGLKDGRYRGFIEKLEPLLISNMSLQAQASPDGIALFDTCAGDFSPEEYGEYIVPVLRRVMKSFKSEHPNTPLVYYSKKTDSRYWDQLRDLPFQCLGIDWNPDIVEVLEKYSDQWAIQGNIDPHWMLDDWKTLEPKLIGYIDRLSKLPAQKRQGWICGLGHGVIKETPQENVLKAVRMIAERCQATF